MPRIITHAEIARVPDGGTFYVEAGAELTPLARERAAARRIELRQGSAPAPSATELEEAARQVLSRIGPVPPEMLEAVVAEVVGALTQSSASGISASIEQAGMPPTVDYCADVLAAARRRARRRAVLTTSGRNQKGIVAILTSIIAEFGGDILDISQTIVGDYFTMLLIVNIDDLNTTFEQFKAAISEAARERNVHAILMHEDLATSMHRV